MKKVLAIAFMGGLIMASCAKTETADETNTMMTESDTMMSDMNETMPMDSTAIVVPAVTDSTMVN